MSSASKACQKLRRKLQRLRKRRDDGELTPGQWLQAQDQAVMEAFPEMTEQEQASIAENFGQLSYALEKHLASRGLPVPGNDPNKPN